MRRLLILVALGAVIELLVTALVRYLRKDFQWLITYADKVPSLDKVALAKFLKQSFDPELGWVPKPNTSNTESVGSIGALSGHDIRSRFSINQYGARENPGHEHLPKTISTYGDSYTFCRQVNDTETWQWYLSELTQTNVLNFGVGNYGIDQALLRLKREYGKNRTDVVILGAVPETIVRILSVWKHYCEYGNVFAFKPRYLITETGISLLPNVVDREEKFYDLARYLPIIQRYDFFYRRKFKRYILGFPYTLSILRHPKRNLRLLFYLLMRKFYIRLGKYYERPWELILEDNKRYCIELYRDRSALQLMLEIIREFAAFAKKEGFVPVFLLLPYQTDLDYARKYGSSYYKEFCSQASKWVFTIDMTEVLLNAEPPLYTNKFYGGHINASGNKIIANKLFSILYDENNFLRRELTLINTTD